ncbi:carboxypeptidase-like regulatory domain-containing protein, partial [Bacteroidales bacterium OttesenSCG-928-J19]|nr:carboxypeptidase-like regulatory domain-containing protein [Bacteroidales bacterium OttesenSCG-928-J19]
DKPSEKIIITPPQIKTPVIKSVGKKVSIELRDSILPDVTYTFDCTDAIIDNNEKNALEGFSFAFSTGDVIDSLVISGLLLNAEDLEPMPNILVGLHADLADSTFMTTAFKRTSMTNDRGQFWIRNVAPGEYRLFALQDMNRDYKFDQAGEAIAFFDQTITPSFEPAFRQDTIWIDSLTIDTILDIKYTRFTPDDVKMFLSKEAFINQYLSKSERATDQRFNLVFGDNVGLPPKIRLLNANPGDDWYVQEYASQAETHTMSYWIRDSLIYQQDTLLLEVNYLATDTLFNLSEKTDTVNLIMRKRQKEELKKKRAEKPEKLELKFNLSGTAEVYDTLKVEFSEPIKRFSETIRFQQKVDTLWQDRNINFSQDSLNPRLYISDYKFPYAGEFRLSVDSALFCGMYDHVNDSVGTAFTVRKEEDYGHLYVLLKGNEYPGIGQLLDASDKVVRQSGLIKGELIFENLKPGKYYLRYIEDRNNNGKWDPAYYLGGEQPETVYYFEAFFDVRMYSEIEHNWDIKAIPIEKQKPAELIKNKPATKKAKRNEQERQRK